MNYNHVCLVELSTDDTINSLFKAFYNWGNTPEELMGDDISHTYIDSLELVIAMKNCGWFLISTNSHTSPNNTLTEKYFFGKL